MATTALPSNVVPYLRDRFRRADIVLFTGAGFSQGARNRDGEVLPLGRDLQPLLWHLCFPSDPHDPRASLQDLFEYARLRQNRQLRDLLLRKLTVEGTSLPRYYEQIFSLPWYRAYTLNVDDLGAALSRQVSLPRPILSVSATSRRARPLAYDESRNLQLMYLNGMLEDAPDGVTFSTTQYAERLARQEPLYAQCAVDVLSRAVVFIGTPLDESPLWQHVELRRRGDPGVRELRRRSFIVTPELDRARRELLEREFNVEHLPLTLEQFVDDVLLGIGDAAPEGMAVLRTIHSTRAERTQVPLAAELAAERPSTSTEYLLGQSPTWADIREGPRCKSRRR